VAHALGKHLVTLAICDGGEGASLGERQGVPGFREQLIALGHQVAERLPHIIRAQPSRMHASRPERPAEPHHRQQ
jgi:hypothetical protein